MYIVNAGLRHHRFILDLSFQTSFQRDDVAYMNVIY